MAGTTGHPIWLVRHASTAWTGHRWCGREDPPLSFVGRQEARELAISLREELPGDTLVRTSPLRRALATAGTIASVRGLPVEIDPDLIEVDVGRLEGLTWDEVRAREPATASAILARGDVDWPGGESAGVLLRRAAAVMAKLDALRAVRPVVVVSHGAFIRALTAMLPAAADEPAVLRPAGLLRLLP